MSANNSDKKEAAAASASASKSEVAEVPDAKAEEAQIETGKETKPAAAPSRQQHNVLIVRRTLPFKSLVIRAKELLKTKFDEIELHAVDDEAYLTVTLVTNCLKKYGYCTLTRLKTKTH